VKVEVGLKFKYILTQHLGLSIFYCVKTTHQTSFNRTLGQIRTNPAIGL